MKKVRTVARSELAHWATAQIARTVEPGIEEGTAARKVAM